MANDSSVKPKKVRGGWTEPISAPAAAPVVAGTPEATKPLSLSWDGVHQALSTALGAPLWQQYGSGKCELKSEQRRAVLETVLDELPLSISNVELLISELHKPNEGGFTLAGSFPALVRIAQEWLATQSIQVEPPKFSEAGQRLMDALNPANLRGFLSEIGAAK